jgi:DNA-binding CsgD family transcriptional regulator
MIALGRWDEAADRLAQASRQADDAGLLMVLDAVVSPFEVARGKFADVEQRLARQRGPGQTVLWPFFLSAYASATASLALWSGDPLAARTAIGGALPRLELATAPIVGHIGPVYALGLWAEADLAAAARREEARENEETARKRGIALLAAMGTLAGEIESRRPVFLPQARAWLATCKAEFGRLEGRPNPDAWAAAAAAWADVGVPYPRGYALMRQGQSLLAERGDRSRAAAAIREGMSIAAGLGARPLLERLEDLAGRLGVAAGSEAATSTPESGPGRRYDLTRREREILDLLAAGRSDGEIAADLFISKKTVSVHINNIKGKLGAESRVGIIRASAALGLIQLGARS